ncbi:hypothetical protein QFC22_006575 [Naganishia vaughanmartiniae]|uniref:Uncharacterized protein n=1 Tax=Naganishia vaughanmartiniae TaxID=1424756 RepID=A0ACC2WIV8_9TREE|nr:hypothetical protein QFC22_006575 [Naganishia vaughanmartiniae]
MSGRYKLKTGEIPEKSSYTAFQKIGLKANSARRISEISPVPMMHPTTVNFTYNALQSVRAMLVARARLRYTNKLSGPDTVKMAGWPFSWGNNIPGDPKLPAFLSTPPQYPPLRDVPDDQRFTASGFEKATIDYSDHSPPSAQTEVDHDSKCLPTQRHRRAGSAPTITPPPRHENARRKALENRRAQEQKEIKDARQAMLSAKEEELARREAAWQPK